jgi:HD-like signal output (HDOD) protein
MDLTTGLAILGAVRTVIDLGERVYRLGSALLKNLILSRTEQKKFYSAKVTLQRLRLIQGFALEVL